MVCLLTKVGDYMSKYDKEREALGIKVTAKTQGTAQKAKRASKYDKERQALFETVTPVQSIPAYQSIAKQHTLEFPTLNLPVSTQNTQAKGTSDTIFNAPFKLSTNFVDIKNRIDQEKAKSEAAAKIPNYNSKSSFYNTPVIGSMLKKDEEKTRQKAKEVLTADEIDILSKGLSLDPKSYNMGGEITAYYFDKKVPEGFTQQFQKAMEKVDYAKKGTLGKVFDRTGRQAMSVGFGDSSAKDYAESAGIGGAGKVGNVISDVGGTIAGFMVPTGSPGVTLPTAANTLAKKAVNKLFPVAEGIANKAGKRVVQGTIESLPYSAQQIATQKEIDTPKQPDYGKGNVDLNDRPTIKNPDGSISTVYSMTFTNDDGTAVLVPGVRKGLDRKMTSEEAWQWYKKTGEYLGKFKTEGEASKYAETLHEDQAKLYSTDYGKIAKNALRTITGNALFGMGAELGIMGLSGIAKTVFKKLKGGQKLTAAEKEVVNNTPELRTLPEAKQYLMLEAPKLRTPDVIESLPPKPTTAEIKKLNTPVKALPKEKEIAEKKADFTVDQYGNTLKSGQKAPLLLNAPKAKAVEPTMTREEYFGKEGDVLTPAEVDELLGNEPMYSRNGIQEVESEISASVKAPERQIERPFAVTKGELKKFRLPQNDNNRKLLKEFSDTMYHETSLDDALPLVDSNYIKDMEYNNIYLSNNKDLALGQGNNKGVLIEFEPNAKLKGNVNKSKPAWELSYQNGDAEFIASKNSHWDYVDSVKSITIKQGAKGSKTASARLKNMLNKWNKTINSDGSATYVNPVKSQPDSSAIASLTEKTRQIERPFAVTKNEAEKLNFPKNITKQSDLIPKEPVVKSQSDWVKSLSKIDTADLAEKQAIKEKARIYDEAANNVKFNVPEQYRKETPFTVARSTVPPKVEGKYAKESATGNVAQGTRTLKTAEQAKAPSAEVVAKNGVQKLKTSQFKTNTIDRTTVIPDKIKKQIKTEDFDFIPETSKEWQDKAIQNIQKDRNAVIKNIREAESISGGTQAHEAAVITQDLVEKAKQGDTEGLLEWLPVVAEKTRETARALKGTDTAWDKASPAGTLVKIQRVLDEVVPKEVKTAVKEEVKSAKPVMEALNKANLDSVDAAFRDITNKPRVSKAVREWLEKQETEATTRVKEYFKPDTSGIIKMRAGLPGEVLTDLTKIGAARLARKTLDFAEWSVEMISEFGEKVKPYLKEIYDNSLNLIKSKSLKTPEQKMNVSVDKAIRQVLSDNGVKLQDIAKKHVSEIDETGQTLAQKFVTEAGLSKDVAEKVEKIFTTRLKELTAAKKKLILDNLFKPKKTYLRKSLSDKIIELSNMGAIGDSKYAKILNEKYNIPGLTAEEAQYIIKQTEQIQGMTNVFKRQASVNKMMSEIQSKIPSSFAAKAKAFTMINTLLNTKTIIARNVPGNIAQATAMRVNKAFMSSIDFTTSKLTGKDRTVTFKTNRGLDNVLKEFFSDIKTGLKSGWEGYNPYGTISEFKMATQAFRGKYNPLTYMEKALGAALSGAGDYPFYMKAVMDSIGEQSVLKAMNEGFRGKALKAQAKIYADGVINSAKNMSEFSKGVLDVANRQGEKATFRDANVISDILKGVHDTLNIAGIGKAQATIGKIPSREFGLGDAVMMFARTPGALLNIGLEYSLAGFAKSLYYIGEGVYKSAKGTGGLNREKLIESITKAVSGTLLLSGTGYYLTAKGAMTGQAPSDKEARNFFDENGSKAYSFNADAIARWALNGFKDDSLLKPQDGDKWYTYDWFAPFSFNIGLGANVAQEGIKLNTLKALPDTFGAGMKTFAENDAISNLLGNNYYQDFGERLTQTLVSMPSRFVPMGSIVNQVRQMTDNTKRDVASDDPKQKAINLIKNRFPGASKTLPAVLTTTGETKEMYAGGSNNPLNVLLSPGYLGIYKKSPGRDLLIDLYKSTGKTSQFPKLQTNKIKIYGTEYPLSNDQKADLQKYVGQMTWSTLDNLITAKSTKGKEFSDLPDETKLKVISNIMEEIGNEAELYMAGKLNIKKPTKQEEKDKRQESEIPKFKMAK
jgi:hypothetical protein